MAAEVEEAAVEWLMRRRSDVESKGCSGQPGKTAEDPLRAEKPDARDQQAEMEGLLEGHVDGPRLKLMPRTILQALDHRPGVAAGPGLEAGKACGASGHASHLLKTAPIEFGRFQLTIGQSDNDATRRDRRHRGVIGWTWKCRLDPPASLKRRHERPAEFARPDWVGGEPHQLSLAIRTDKLTSWLRTGRGFFLEHHAELNRRSEGIAVAINEQLNLP